MAELPRISEAEWEVMKVLWADAPLTANDVVKALAGRRHWSPRTIKTLLNRLVGKGALSYQVDGKRYLYRPTVSLEKCVRRESASFVQRVFGGQAASMLVHLVRQARLSQEEIAELRKILRHKRGE